MKKKTPHIKSRGVVKSVNSTNSDRLSFTWF